MPEGLRQQPDFFQTHGVREVAEYFRDAIIWDPETNRAVRFLALEVWPKDMELLPGERRNQEKRYGDMSDMPVGSVYTKKTRDIFQSLINCSDQPGGQPGACVRPTAAEYGVYSPETGGFEFANEFEEENGRLYAGREGTIAAFFGLEVAGNKVKAGRPARLVQSENNPQVFILVKGGVVAGELPDVQPIAEQSDPAWEALFHMRGEE